MLAALVAVGVLLGIDGGGANDDATAIARALPRVTYRGGPFLRHARVVTVTFAGDDAALVARLARFGAVATRGAWWRAVTDGYCAPSGACVGAGRPGAHVVLDATLRGLVHGNAVAVLLTEAAAADRLGPLDHDTLLLVYLPADVTLTDAFVPRYCDDGPRAFHRALRLASATIPYAVVPRCGDESSLTATASHEILEATTNPDPAARGFAFTTTSATAGFTAAGIEPVDPCGLLTRNAHQATADGFTVQRAWSNRAAARGEDPCVPSASDQPYRSLVPEQPAIRLAPGDQTHLRLTASASGPAGSWAVSTVDLTGAQDGTRYVDVALDRTHVVPGDTVMLTITALRAPPNGRVIIGAVSASSNATSLWPIAVVMR